MSIFIARQSLPMGGIYIVRSPTVGFSAAPPTGVMYNVLTPVYVTQTTGTAAVIADSYRKA